MSKSVQLLLIEDDAEDVELFEDVLKTYGSAYYLKVIRDGGEFSDYIKNNENPPDLIVMDFNLPKMHGREILKLIKTNELYKNIPVVILTTSSAPEDKNYAMVMGAEEYFVKPNSMNELKMIVGSALEICYKCSF
jgi:CheY-like chemotaxis protein